MKITIGRKSEFAVEVHVIGGVRPFVYAHIRWWVCGRRLGYRGRPAVLCSASYYTQRWLDHRETRTVIAADREVLALFAPRGANSTIEPGCANLSSTVPRRIALDLMSTLEDERTWQIDMAGGVGLHDHSLVLAIPGKDAEYVAVVKRSSRRLTVKRLRLGVVEEVLSQFRAWVDENYCGEPDGSSRSAAQPLGRKARTVRKDGT